jgi:prevent-host-death family protein
MMRSIGALEAKNRFGELLDTARREPVTIEKHGRPVAVMLSTEDYHEFEALKLAQLRGEIRKGFDDLEAGRVVNGAKALEEISTRYK